MAKARREMEGEAVAFLVRLIPVSLFEVASLEMAIDKLNPFKERKPESAAMKRHKAKIAAMKFKGGR